MIKHFIPVTLLITIIVFVFVFLQLQEAGSDGVQCTLRKNTCALNVKDGPVFVQISSTIQLEEEVDIEIKYPTSLRYQKAVISGINMYMGETPIIIELNKAGLTKGKFFLGACSEPDMRWQMAISFEDENKQTQKAYVNFQTSQ